MSLSEKYLKLSKNIGGLGLTSFLENDVLTSDSKLNVTIAPDNAKLDLKIQ